MKNVPSDARSDEQTRPGDTRPVPHKGSGRDGHDLRWDMKLQEGSFYTQAAILEFGPPTNVTSVPTPVKSRHWLGLDIWGIPEREKCS